MWIFFLSFWDAAVECGRAGNGPWRFHFIGYWMGATAAVWGA